MSARVKVSLAFQLSQDAAVVRRKKVLSLQASDSIQRIYETISGRSGGLPLWPKDFGERLDSGEADAQLFYNANADGSGDPAETAIWQTAPATCTLGDLVRNTSQGAVADLLLRIIEPQQQQQPCLSVDEFGGGEGAMYYSRTFLHFKEEEDSPQGLTPRALSDPISQRCATPMSRVSSKGSLGLLEQAEQDRQHRKSCENYIQKKLLPHLGQGSRSVDERQSSHRGMPSYSPMRISDPSLNLPTSMMAPGMSLARGGEPAYLPSGHPMSVPPPQRPPPPPSMQMDAQRGSQYAKPRMELQPMQSSMESPRELWESSEPGDAAIQQTANGGWSATIAAPQPLDPYHVSVITAGAALQPPLFDACGPGPSGRPVPDMQYRNQLQPMRSSMEPPGELWENTESGDVSIRQPPNRGWSANAQAPQPIDHYHVSMLTANAALQPPLFTPCGPQDRRDDDDDDPRQGPLMSQSSAVFPHPQGGMLPLATSKAEELFDVVSRNDIRALRELLDSKVDVNECTAKGSHVLFRAVIKARELDMVHMLLNAGADARSTDEKGNQVMHFWARATVGRNHLLDMGRALLLAGADINAQRFNDGMSPLHHVVVGHNNRRGWLDFHKALMLVRHGANIYLRTHVSQMPLSLVSVDGRAATKKLIQLLQCGIQEGRSDWPRCDHVGCTWCL
mmetsp:Transcript_41557/g.104427  ORF Transcript_41557/g.104427 Transcript_41557/m.104427 type:complete len:677 (-) Transcript_41557:85-2115(-)